MCPFIGLRGTRYTTYPLRLPMQTFLRFDYPSDMDLFAASCLQALFAHSDAPAFNPDGSMTVAALQSKTFTIWLHHLMPMD